MKSKKRILIILQFILHIFVVSKNNLCYTSINDNTSLFKFNIIDQNYFLCSQTNKNVQHLKVNNNQNKPLNQDYYQIYLKPETYNEFNSTVHSTLKMQLQNDSISFLNMFSQKYHDNLINNQVSYFFQVGAQHLLSNKTIILGLGTKQILNNKHVIGYNTLFHVPVFSPIQQPYSLNVGGEFWYKNLIFLLNSYYNLDTVINFKKPLCDDPLIYPQFGYQAQLKIKLPYILDCQGQMKWEQFSFSKRQENSQIYLNKFNKNQCLLILGMQYQPMPILAFNIDNIFMHKKYINTAFKIALNYQFNTPINQQIFQKHYHKKMLSLKDLNVIIEPFIPNSDFGAFIKRLIISTKTVPKIIGYPGEVQYIQTNDDCCYITSSLDIDPNSTQFHDNRVIYIKDNTYAVCLSKTPMCNSKESQNKSIDFDCNNDNINKTNEMYNIPIVIKNYKMKNIDTQKINSSSIVNVYHQEDSSCSIVEQNNLPLYQENTPNIDNINNSTNNTISINTNTNNTDHNSNNHDQCLNIPPIPPKLPDFKYDCNNQSLSSKKEEVSDTLTNNNIASSSTAIISQCETKNIHDSSTIKNNDLFYQLSMQKNAKFSSIGTQEYIDKLERSITERKKDKRITDMEKMFNKLHMAESHSSLAESIETNDSSDNFSELSNF